MASGPKIPVISDGDALLGSTIRTALKNIQNFLGSIPADNLQVFNCRVESIFKSANTLAPGDTEYEGYRDVALGGGSAAGDSSKVYGVDFVITLSAAFSANDAITVTLEKATTVGGAYTTLTGCSAAFTNADKGTTLASTGGDNFTYHKRVTPTATEISPGEYIRMKISNSGGGGAGNVTRTTATIGMSTMIQP